MMNINISHRHEEPSPTIEKHIRKRLERLEKFSKRIISVDVTLEREGAREIVEVCIKPGKGEIIIIKNQDYDLRKAFDKVDKKLERTLKRYEKRLKEKQVKSQEF